MASVGNKIAEILPRECKAELVDNILPYWSMRMVDEKRGGFFGRIDGNDTLHETAPKSIILNTRILWTFSHAARHLGSAYAEMAHRSYEYIITHFIDNDFGGVYWMISYDGLPDQTKKQVYAQAFCIYAFAEYYQLTKNEHALEHAVRLFRLLEQHSFDQSYNGYLEAFDREWRLLDDLRLSAKDANEKKTMNTHLHVLEAYTNLYRCWPDEFLKKQLANLIRLFIERLIDENGNFGLFFDDQWKRKSHKISYGHDVEGSWLLYEAAAVLGESHLIDHATRLAIKMVDVTISHGMHPEGGLKNESDDAARDWWPQAEALVGLVNAFQLSGNLFYLEKAMHIWTFIKESMIDKQNGEWYWGRTADGEVNRQEDKAGPWKCPYHNSRAMLEIIHRLGHKE